MTGYCIRFKALKDINIDTLEAAIRYGLRLRACDIRVLFAYRSGPLGESHLWSTPVVFPFYRAYNVLRQS